MTGRRRPQPDEAGTVHGEGTAGEGQPSYSFKGSDENVYGRYLRATYNLEKENGWIVALIVMALCWLWFLFVVNNPDMFSGDGFANPTNGTPGTPGRYLLSVTGVPVAWAALFLFPLIFVYIVGAMVPGGWEAHGNLWARLHRWNLSFSRGRNKVDHDYYFDGFERTTSDVAVFEDHVLVGEGDEAKEVPYSDIGRAFFGNGFFIVRTISDVFEGDVIADIGCIKPGKVVEFIDFIKEKVPEDTKVYVQ